MASVNGYGEDHDRLLAKAHALLPAPTGSIPADGLDFWRSESVQRFLVFALGQCMAGNPGPLDDLARQAAEANAAPLNQALGVLTEGVLRQVVGYLRRVLP